MTDSILVTADIYRELEEITDPLVKAIDSQLGEEADIEEPRDELVAYISSLWQAIEAVGHEEAAETLLRAFYWAIDEGPVEIFEEPEDFEDQILSRVERATQLMGDLLVPATEEGYRDDADLGSVQSEQVPPFSEEYPSVVFRGSRYVFVDEFRDAYEPQLSLSALQWRRDTP